MQTNQMPEPPKRRLSLAQTEEVTCSCGHNMFHENTMLRKMSRILTGEEKDTLIPVQILICSKCATPLDFTIPPELKAPKLVS